MTHDEIYGEYEPICTISREIFTECFNECVEIFEKHQEELSEYGGRGISDGSTYEMLESMGNHLFLVARNVNNEICGYASYIIGDSLHFEDCIVAHSDLIYLSPAYRGYGIALDILEMAETILSEEFDVDYIHLNGKFGDVSIEKLGSSKGYRPQEIIYSKDIRNG